MVKITVELLPPFAKTKRTIARAEIVNKGTGGRDRGNYWYGLWGKRAKIWREGHIDDFPRKSYSVWRLLYYILKQVFE